MKNMLKHAAFLVGLPFFMGWFFGAGIIVDGVTVMEWLETFSRAVQLADPTTTLLALTLLLSVVGILFFLACSRKKAPPPEPFPRTSRDSVRKEQKLRPIRPEVHRTATKDKVKVAEEWKNLDDADKEVIREIVSQKGLWETDIIALLQARGFVYHTAHFDSLAERVSFVHCDYAGYHSIPPEYQAPLEVVLSNDSSEGYQ